MGDESDMDGTADAEVDWGRVKREEEERRVELVRRVLRAMTEETGLPWVPAVRMVEDVLKRIVERVEW